MTSTNELWALVDSLGRYARSNGETICFDSRGDAVEWRDKHHGYDGAIAYKPISLGDDHGE